MRTLDRRRQKVGRAIVGTISILSALRLKSYWKRDRLISIIKGIR